MDESSTQLPSIIKNNASLHEENSRLFLVDELDD